MLGLILRSLDFKICVGVPKPRHLSMENVCDRYFKAVKSCCSNTTLKISVKLTQAIAI
ncbi:hypothetical protein I8752_10065 [Nostocaceae cyanobacterium CENA369]|uniref:Uncharacterized protein n=1 Tax=Dendronalium phyllosphericum CENA369 TaxID=1725256 RepID=A0A8J7I5H5_9NOST|nr:hypothetical protein [Dendronalium phyllosphericum]MBH8573351.1 hypothetical protein [Dendronalium phyllosphericum CENA369]